MTAVAALTALFTRTVAATIGLLATFATGSLATLKRRVALATSDRLAALVEDPHRASLRDHQIDPHQTSQRVKNRRWRCTVRSERIAMF